MSNIAKVIEVVASSPESWEEAVRTAVREASRSVRGITGVDVQNWTARVEAGELVDYNVNVKIAFGIEGDGDFDGDRRRSEDEAGDGGRGRSSKKGRKGRKNR
ncbi:MAG: dodecin family protein [Acidobacteriota bacterium]